MLLQPTTSNLPLYLQNHSNHTVSLSSNFSYSISFPYGGFSDLTNFIPISSHKNPVLTCSISQIHNSYGTKGYAKRPMVDWKTVFKRICLLEESNMDSGSVLDQWEKEGKLLPKWDLLKIIKELRKVGRYKFALGVYEWMNNREEMYRFTAGDTAIQLDLIAKVRGIESAERYFFTLPDSLKDNRIYGALLNSYVRNRMKEKAESLMEKMKEQRYATSSLAYNVMMTLYRNLENYDKVESVISEMREKNIPLDIYSYNIWLSSCGSQGSIEKMEHVAEEMELDRNIHPNWIVYSTMATAYIRVGLLDKAEECLKKVEHRIRDQNHIPYHFLINLYGIICKKQEVLRVWNIYKSMFAHIPNSGYYVLIASLLRQDDIECAEKFYKEWLLVKSRYDLRIGNLLLGWYFRQGFSEKAEAFYHKMIECGGNPNSRTWEIFAEVHIRERRISEALACLKDAVSINGSKRWRPRPTVVSSILEFCEQEGDLVNREAMLEVLRQVGCLDDESYMSNISIFNGSHYGGESSITKDRTEDDNDYDDDVLLNKLLASL